MINLGTSIEKLCPKEECPDFPPIAVEGHVCLSYVRSIEWSAHNEAMFTGTHRLGMLRSYSASRELLFGAIGLWVGGRGET